MQRLAQNTSSLWTPITMSNGRVIYSFNGANSNGGDGADFKYAPSTRDSLYIQCHAGHKSLGTLFGNFFSNKDNRQIVYVSILVLFHLSSVLRDGYKKKEGLAKCDGNGINLGLPNPTTEAFIEFIRDSVPLVSSRGLPHGGIQFYVRLEDGSLKGAKAAKQTGAKAWDALRTYYINGAKAYSARPSRHLNFKLTHPLIVQIIGIRTRLFKQRIGGNGNAIIDWFQGLIDSVNGSKKEGDKDWFLAQNRTRNDDGSWDMWEPIERDYIHVSTDPFGIYFTYVHKEDWTKYMSSLKTSPPQGKKDVPVVRQFPNKDLDVFRDLLDKLAFADYRAMQHIDPLKMKETFNLTNDDLAYAREVVTQNNLDKGRQMGEDELENRIAGILAMWENAKVNGVNKLQNFIDANKMETAVGTRATVCDQKRTMAGVSASDLAEKLNWETWALKTNFSSSEWLHLSAFSYGGYGDAGEYATSQTPLNLVFGTSEANSLMTRHEMAWQRLLHAEQDLVEYDHQYGEGGRRTAEARLSLTINEPDAAICYDAVDYNGNYSLQWLTIGSERANRISKNPRFNSDDPGIIYQTPEGDGTTLDEMARLANFYPFLAYSIKYEIRFDTFSSILATKSAWGQTYFFPFQRSWFHTAESRLDGALFRDLEKFAWEDLREDIADSNNETSSAKPKPQKGNAATRKKHEQKEMSNPDSFKARAKRLVSGSKKIKKMNINKRPGIVTVHKNAVAEDDLDEETVMDGDDYSEP